MFDCVKCKNSHDIYIAGSILFSRSIYGSVGGEIYCSDIQHGDGGCVNIQGRACRMGHVRGHKAS